MRSLLVTGGCGFIGSHLVERLSGNFLVSVFDNIKPRKESKNVRYYHGDITHLNDLKAIGRNFDGIVHLAGLSRASDGFKEPNKCLHVNVIGTANILDFARSTEIRPWVLLGSTIESAKNIYGLSKYIGELCAERYALDFDLKVLALRFASVYGSGRDNSDKVIPKLITRALSDQEIVIDNAKVAIDFVHISDLVAGICRGAGFLEAISEESFYDVAPLCTGHNTTLVKLVELITGETGSKSIIVLRNKDSGTASNISPEKAMRLLNFTAEIGIVQGIKETIRSMRDIESSL
jgi:nucleoside-diphosphate-sugar epimerase